MSQDSCGSCSQSGSCSEQGKTPEQMRMERTLGRIKNTIVVLSGKGGVGKSSVAVNIAVALSLAGKKVGLMDVDVHGPSVPRLLSLTGAQPHIEPEMFEPVPWSKNLSVMSLGFMLPNKEEAVIWRGPVKMGLITQFVRDVAWGDLDYLIVDCPPGTGDEPLSVLQTIGPKAVAVIVTTPQGVAVDDVRRSVTFCRTVGNPVLGVVENMSTFICPDCGKEHAIFGSGGGKALAAECGVPFLGTLPIDPEMTRAGDEGYPLIQVSPDSPTGKALQKVIEPMLKMTA